jgi:hypothetical protein
MLQHLDAREITVGGRAASLILGRGPLALEVVVLDFPIRPRVTEVRELFNERVGRPWSGSPSTSTRFSRRTIAWPPFAGAWPSFAARNRTRA